MRRVLLLAVLLPVAAMAQVVVQSSPPGDTSVTIYRAPDGGLANGPIDPREPAARLDGYALITETREVDLPAGPAVARFAGVAAGMLAESVVVSGLPPGSRERNLDAELLSPRHLYAGWFGRPVMVQRRDKDTGALRTERAVIRSAPDGAAIVETDHGFEALNCGPFNDAIAYPGVPDGLYAKPTLSIATDAPAPMHVRLRLSYLAWDFDWRADYVMTLSRDLRHGVLNAWVTLASADVTAYPYTTASVVAGKPHFSDSRDDDDGDDQDLIFTCHAFPPLIIGRSVPAPMALSEYVGGDIVVTAMRKVAVARVEDLGDLKLVRLPLPTTIAARGQKQVALFAPRNVALTVVHTASLDFMADHDAVDMMIRTRNRAADGLGLPLPAGQMRVRLNAGSLPLVAGEGPLQDRAINDRVDVAFAASPAVHVQQEQVAHTKTTQTVLVTVTNANRFAVPFAGTFKQTPAAAISNPSAPLAMEDGHRLWSVRVPAQGSATLRYTVKDTD